MAWCLEGEFVVVMEKFTPQGSSGFKKQVEAMMEAAREVRDQKKAGRWHPEQVPLHDDGTCATCSLC